MNGQTLTGQNEGELRIVVGVDGSSGATRALEYAARRAADGDALLLIVCAYDMLPAEDSLMIPIGLIQDAAASVVRQALDHVGAITPGVVAKGEHVFGAPGRVLVEASEGATALVVGSRGHGHIVDMLLGSVSDYVVHHASCTTTVVR